LNGSGERAIVVLGMHRSGTSAVTGALALAGAQTPRHPMPATGDNPSGYWESPRIARFNNRLLEAAGTRWNDPAGIPDGWFREPTRASDAAEVASLVAGEFPGHGPPALKDPRICRLLPVWLHGLEVANCEPVVLFVVRRPLDVAASLAARSEREQFRSASVPNLAGGILLWLRYILDAERHSRILPRHLVAYETVIDDWRSGLGSLIAAARLPPPGAEVADRIGAFLDPGLRRQRVAGAEGRFPGLAVAERVREAVLEAGREPLLDDIRTDLDRLQLDQSMAGRSASPPTSTAPEAILDQLDLRWRLTATAPRATSRPARSVFFLSGEPRSVSHVYRVENAVAALRAHGWQANWAPTNDPLDLDLIARADVITVFRAAWSPALASVRNRCQQAGIPLVFDIDDLLFDPAVASAGSIALLDEVSEADRGLWKARVAGYRATLSAADLAILTTKPLAAAARAVCPRAFVLPNALGPACAAAAAQARVATKPSAVDGRPRLIFASGTPTHHRDFAVAAEAVARLFRQRSEPRLIVLGHLDLDRHPVLAPFRDRVECRPRVPFGELFAEVARADVNLCPLELGNPFCESKSAVRWLAAAAVGVPSVVSPTEPLREAIRDGETGILAGDVTAWERALEQVVSDPAFRVRLGLAAQGDALARFGFDPWSRLAVDTYAKILERGRIHHHGAPE
jgi:glycosyltransferase involved in cell wall biosynthesis